MKYIYLKNKKGEVIGHLEFSDLYVNISMIKSFINGYLCRDDLTFGEEELTNLLETLIEKNYIMAYHFDFSAEQIWLDC